MTLTPEMVAKLCAKFPDDKLGVKAQSYNDKNNPTKVMLVLYLQHTDVAERLDEVDPNWSFRIISMGQGFAHGELTLGGAVRQNFGEGDDQKMAASDALKRCAVLFGVGRYLYESETLWVPFGRTDKYKVWTIEEYRKALAEQAKRGKAPQVQAEAPKAVAEPMNKIPDLDAIPKLQLEIARMIQQCSAAIQPKVRQTLEAAGNDLALLNQLKLKLVTVINHKGAQS